MGMKREPRVGIFWLVNGRLLIDSIPLNEAELYGDNLTHARGHVEVWERFQQKGMVLAEVEYEESPRGRVMYNTKTQRFLLLSDRCILKDKSLVQEIMRALGLPITTEIGTDDHYRCSHCLHGGTKDAS